MVWTIEYDPAAQAEIKRLGKTAARRITHFLENRVALRDDPRTLGAVLTGSVLGGYWKYRVGDYRVVADIQDKKLTILVVRIGNRRDVYKHRK